MKVACAGVLAALSMAAGATPARAQEAPPPRLQVERDEGAGECPDGPALRSAVDRIRERADTGTSPYRVRFSRDGAGFAVSITAEPSGRARTLTAGDATCGAIANAAAVTLALLFDAEADSAPAVTPVAAPLPVSAPPPSTPQPPITPRAPPLYGVLGVGGGVLVGVTAPVAPAFTLDAGIRTPRFRASAGAGWAPSQATRLSPGEVRTELAFGTIRLCVAALPGAPRLHFCSGLYGGIATAEASGFTVNERRQRGWLAVPVEAAVTLGPPSFGVELAAAALLPIARGDFGIDGLGVAYRSAAIGGVAWLRVTLGTRLGR